MSNIVYSIPCKSWSGVYIGQTGLSLNTWIDEHKTAVKHAKYEVSAGVEHVWIHKHQVDFQSVSILVHEHHLHHRLSVESWFIRMSSKFKWERDHLCQYIIILLVLYFILCRIWVWFVGFYTLYIFYNFTFIYFVEFEFCL